MASGWMPPYVNVAFGSQAASSLRGKLGELGASIHPLEFSSEAVKLFSFRRRDVNAVGGD
jgi:hypothetical protein